MKLTTSQPYQKSVVQTTTQIHVPVPPPPIQIQSISVIQNSLKTSVASIADSMLKVASTLIKAHLSIQTKLSLNPQILASLGQDNVSKRMANWNKEINETCLSFKKRFSRVLSDLKYFINFPENILSDVSALSAELANHEFNPACPEYAKSPNGFNELIGVLDLRPLGMGMDLSNGMGQSAGMLSIAHGGHIGSSFALKSHRRTYSLQASPMRIITSARKVTSREGTPVHSVIRKSANSQVIHQRIPSATTTTYKVYQQPDTHRKSSSRMINHTVTRTPIPQSPVVQYPQERKLTGSVERNMTHLAVPPLKHITPLGNLGMINSQTGVSTKRQSTIRGNSSAALSSSRIQATGIATSSREYRRDTIGSRVLSSSRVALNPHLGSDNTVMAKLQGEIISQKGSRVSKEEVDKNSRIQKRISSEVFQPIKMDSNRSRRERRVSNAESADIGNTSFYLNRDSEINDSGDHYPEKRKQTADFQQAEELKNTARSTLSKKHELDIKGFNQAVEMVSKENVMDASNFGNRLNSSGGLLNEVEDLQKGRMHRLSGSNLQVVGGQEDQGRMQGPVLQGSSSRRRHRSSYKEILQGSIVPRDEWVNSKKIKIFKIFSLIFLIFLDDLHC